MSAIRSCRPLRCSAWPVSLALNLTVGFALNLPLMVLWQVLLGRFERSPEVAGPTEAALSWLLVSVPLVLVFAGTNYAVLRLTRVPARPYWAVSALALCVPSLLLTFSPGFGELSVLP
ncbi:MULTISPECIES: hypothetical protein [unclassified Streptomyces]|uniref:hypothetical protein n=1 Tax=unclassified Streptomyces TaxID=2593676 RepID=UPI003663E644